MEARGKNFLLVCGIIMIVFGAISSLASIIAIFGVAVLLATGMVLTAIQGVVGIIASVCELVTGIVGVVNCKKPEKAGTCMTLGIILIALQAISFILGLIGGSFGIIGLILGLILPVLYVIGANLNKNS